MSKLKRNLIGERGFSYNGVPLLNMAGRAEGVSTMTGKFAIVAEFWQFMKERKKWWLGPIVIMLLLLGLLIVLTEGSAVAPFVYALF